MKKHMKKIIVVCILMVLAVPVAFLAKRYIDEKNQSGVLIAFDDYNEGSWEEHFDMFDEYGAKVTFFVNASEPTDFCHRAVARGHEIGYHTKNHVNMTEITEEEVYEQAIAPIEIFREKGIELTSFAYPYGAYTEELNELLLQHYEVVRGAYSFELNDKDKMTDVFVESRPVDNVKFETEEEFQTAIAQTLEEARIHKGTVVSVYSHAISGGDWCITSERLEFILQEAKNRGLKFYTFKDLQ